MAPPDRPEASGSPSTDISSKARKAYGEYLLLQGTREEIDLDGLCLEHPTVATELRALDRRMQQAAGSTQPSGTQPTGTGPSTEAPERISLEDSSSFGSSTLRRILEAGPASERYVHKGEINRGGMGAILKVWDEDLRRTLAMKIVLGGKQADDSTDQKRLSRFLEEAQITGQLDHPGVVPVHEVGMDSSGQVYFTMRLVRGRDLKEIFRLVHDRREGWNLTRALGVMLKVCEAMAFAHEKGVIHRDLKPANIMVGRFGETYVMDWGLAKVLGGKDHHDLRLREVDLSLSMVHTDRDDSNRTPDSPLVTMDGDIVGTPCYMAPEQARGRLEEVGPASDVYAVGSMLYTLLCDRMPYVEPGDRMSPPAVLGLLLHGPPTPISELTRDVPGELIAICEKAMAREPAQRYASTMEMGEDLRAYLEDRVVTAYEAGSVAEFRKWISRNKGMAISIGAAVVLALAGLGGVAWVQAAANEELVALNEDIEDARDDALSANADLGQANAALEAASQRALDSEREALRSGYAANLSAAAASLRAMNALEAQQRLERCAEDLRGWEWDYLRLAADSSLRTIELEHFRPSTLAFSPDGQHLAAGFGGTLDRFADARLEGGAMPIRVLDVVSGELAFTLAGHGGTTTGLAFTPDGARIVSGSYDRSLSVWDARTHERLQHVRNAGGFITELSVSPDGLHLAVATHKKRAFIVGLEDLDGPRLELSGHGSGISAITYSHDGTRIATGSRDRSVRLWDAASGSELAVLQGHGETITALSFSPDDQLLASASGEKSQSLLGTLAARSEDELFLWDLRSQKRLRKLEGHTHRIRSLAFAPGTRTLASASEDGSLRLWDTATGEGEVQLGHFAGVDALAFNPSGDLLATGSQDETVRLWDPRVARGIDLDGHRRAVVGVAFSEHDGRLISVSSDRTIRSWSPVSGAELNTWASPLEAIPDAALAPLAGEVALVDGEGGRVWSMTLGRTRLELEPQGDGLTGIWIAPDAARVVLGCKDGSLRILDGTSGAILDVLEAPEEANASVTRVLATPGASEIYFLRANVLYRWDFESEVPVMLSPDDTSPVEALAMDPRGTRIAVAHEDGNLSIFDAATGTLRSSMSKSATGVKALAFDDAAERLAVASANRSVRLWDVAAGEPLLTLRYPSGVVRSLSFDSATERLAAGFDDGRIHVWCTRTGADRHAERVRHDRARRMAQPILTALFEELVEPSRVIAELGKSHDITADVKAAAIAVARSIDAAPARLESECLAALHRPRSQPAVYQRALWLARLGVLRQPGDESTLRLLGMALARLGRHAEALGPLEQAHAERTRHRRARPEVLAYLALCQHYLGRTEEAARTLDQLRSLMRISAVMGTEYAFDYLHEVEDLIDPGR